MVIYTVNQGFTFVASNILLQSKIGESAAVESLEKENSNVNYEEIQSDHNIEIGESAIGSPQNENDSNE